MIGKLEYSSNVIPLAKKDSPEKKEEEISEKLACDLKKKPLNEKGTHYYEWMEATKNPEEDSTVKEVITKNNDMEALKKEDKNIPLEESEIESGGVKLNDNLKITKEKNVEEAESVAVEEVRQNTQEINVAKGAESGNKTFKEGGVDQEREINVAEKQEEIRQENFEKQKFSPEEKLENSDIKSQKEIFNDLRVDTDAMYVDGKGGKMKVAGFNNGEVLISFLPKNIRLDKKGDNVLMLDSDSSGEASEKAMKVTEFVDFFKKYKKVNASDLEIGDEELNGDGTATKVGSIEVEDVEKNKGGAESMTSLQESFGVVGSTHKTADGSRELEILRYYNLKDKTKWEIGILESGAEGPRRVSPDELTALLSNEYVKKGIIPFTEEPMKARDFVEKFGKRGEFIFKSKQKGKENFVIKKNDYSKESGKYKIKIKYVNSGTELVRSAAWLSKTIDGGGYEKEAVNDSNSEKQEAITQEADVNAEQEKNNQENDSEEGIKTTEETQTEQNANLDKKPEEDIDTSEKVEEKPVEQEALANEEKQKEEQKKAEQKDAIGEEVKDGIVEDSEPEKETLEEGVVNDSEIKKDSAEQKDSVNGEQQEGIEKKITDDVAGEIESGEVISEEEGSQEEKKIKTAEEQAKEKTLEGQVPDLEKKPEEIKNDAEIIEEKSAEKEVPLKVEEQKDNATEEPKVGRRLLDEWEKIMEEERIKNSEASEQIGEEGQESIPNMEKQQQQRMQVSFDAWKDAQVCYEKKANQLGDVKRNLAKMGVSFGADSEVMKELKQAKKGVNEAEEKFKLAHSAFTEAVTLRLKDSLDKIKTTEGKESGSKEKNETMQRWMNEQGVVDSEEMTENGEKIPEKISLMQDLNNKMLALNKIKQEALSEREKGTVGKLISGYSKWPKKYKIAAGMALAGALAAGATFAAPVSGATIAGAGISAGAMKGVRSLVGGAAGAYVFKADKGARDKTRAKREEKIATKEMGKVLKGNDVDLVSMMQKKMNVERNDNIKSMVAAGMTGFVVGGGVKALTEFDMDLLSGMSGENMTESVPVPEETVVAPVINESITEPVIDSETMSVNLKDGSNVWKEVANHYDGDQGETAETINAFEDKTMKELQRGGMSESEAEKFIDWKFKHLPVGQVVELDEDGLKIDGFVDQKSLDEFGVKHIEKSGELETIEIGPEDPDFARAYSNFKARGFEDSSAYKEFQTRFGPEAHEKFLAKHINAEGVVDENAERFWGRRVRRGADASMFRAETDYKFDLAKDLAKKMGIEFNPNEDKLFLEGNVPTKINGQEIPMDVLSEDQQRSVLSARKMKAAMSGNYSISPDDAEELTGRSGIKFDPGKTGVTQEPKMPTMTSDAKVPEELLTKQEQGNINEATLDQENQPVEIKETKIEEPAPAISSEEMSVNLKKGSNVWKEVENHYNGDQGDTAETINAFEDKTIKELQQGGMSKSEAEKFIDWKFKHLPVGQVVELDENGLKIDGFVDQKSLDKFNLDHETPTNVVEEPLVGSEEEYEEMPPAERVHEDSSLKIEETNAMKSDELMNAGLEVNSRTWGLAKEMSVEKLLKNIPVNHGNPSIVYKELIASGNLFNLDELRQEGILDGVSYREFEDLQKISNMMGEWKPSGAEMSMSLDDYLENHVEQTMEMEAGQEVVPDHVESEQSVPIEANEIESQPEIIDGKTILTTENFLEHLPADEKVMLSKLSGAKFFESFKDASDKLNESGADTRAFLNDNKVGIEFVDSLNEKMGFVQHKLTQSNVTTDIEKYIKMGNTVTQEQMEACAKLIKNIEKINEA